MNNECSSGCCIDGVCNAKSYCQEGMKANSDYCDQGSECNSGVCYMHRCDIYVQERGMEKVVDGVITVVAVIIVLIAIILSCNREVRVKKEPKK